MVLTAWVAVKFGINTTLVVLEMVNFTRLRLVKFIPISNTTLVIFIPNFTATHAITSTSRYQKHYIIYHQGLIRTSNSMGSSEIWDKYHECWIGNGDKFHEAKPSEIYHFQHNKSGIYPKFHCYPCYSQLIPYSLHIHMLCISIAMYAICHYVLNTHQH